jgi:hypothetical protein
VPVRGPVAGGDGGEEVPTDGAAGGRDATTLHRDAVAIRRMLDDLGPDEHGLRSRLVSARFAVRAEAATDWRRRGWRPVTDER